jgi:hypothetical protein
MEKNMTDKVKTTRIEKKYKDKKTGEYKSITIDYAKVVDRLNEFRGSNPRGLIETKPSVQNNYIFFQARIVKDKSDKNSAEATGHAVEKLNGSDKQFEKLETLAVGRALAMLGYSAGGEIASKEEMDDYYGWKQAQVNDAVAKLESAKTVDELRETFMSLGSLIAHSEVQQAKDKRKEELNANTTSRPEQRRVATATQG